MRINYNTSAMIALNGLNANNTSASKSTEKLSSGYKINRAKDNPAGYALSRRMQAQLRGLEQAGDNASDGISVLETADGALAEIHEMLQRMNELAVKAANGTFSDADRKLVNDEVQALKDEIQRVSDTTEFNGQKLLDGSFDLKSYTTDNNVKTITQSDDVQIGVYEFLFTGLVQDENGNIHVADPDNEEDQTNITVKETATITKVQGLEVSEINGNLISVSGAKGFEMTFEVNIDELVKDEKQYAEKDENGDIIYNADGSVKSFAVAFSVEVTGLGAMTLQVGSNEGQTLDVRIPDTGVKNLGLEETDVLTQANADAAIRQIEKSISKLSAYRSKIGAYQNRLESTVSTIGIEEQNMTSSFATITDVDMAEEYTNYSTYQVLTQASTSVLAQANERPSQVLQLLQ